MKVLVTSQSSDTNGLVDPRFGRAKYLFLFDTDTGDVEVHDNYRGLKTPEGAGIETSRRAISMGADVVVTGQIGPKALRALSAGGIAVYMRGEGSANDALAAVRAGQLDRVERPTVEGHWG